MNGRPLIAKLRPSTAVLCLWLFYGLGMSPLVAQPHPTALPPISNYSPEDYEGAAQNWAVAQDANGIIYAGNNQGLLSFDGVEWSLKALPNNSAVRALTTDSSGNIWVGGQNFFGQLTWEPKTGRPKLTPLSQGITEKYGSFGGVPNIHVLPSGEVAFHSFQGIFLFNPADSSFSSITPTNRFQPSFLIDGEFYVNETGIGLQVLKSRQVELLPNGEFFADKRVELIFPHPRGQWLISTEESGLFLGSPQEGWEKYADIPREFTEKSPIFTGVSLPNGQYVLGTHRNGLLLLNEDFKPIQHLNKESGLRNNLIWGMSVDRQGDLWLGLDNGLSHVQWTAPFTKFEAEGSVLSTAIYQDRLYTGTTQGIYQTQWKDWLSPFKPQNTQFQPIASTEEQAWQLYPTDQGVVAPHIQGLFQIEGEEASRQWEGFAWRVAPIPNSSDSLIMGTRAKGIWLLTKENDSWQPQHQIGKDHGMAKYLVVQDQKIWVSNPIEGLFCINVTPDYQEVTNIKQYSRKHGLPSDTYNFIFDLPSLGLCVATEKGIYRFDERKELFYPDSAFPPLPELRKLQEDEQGRIWFYASKSVGVLQPIQGRRYRLEQLRAMRLLKNKDIYSIYPYGQYLFLGTPQGLLCYDMERSSEYGKSDPPSYQALIQSFRDISADSAFLRPAHAQQQRAVVLPAEKNSVRFKVAASWFQEPKKIRFKYYLEGFDERASGWTSNPECTYTNLPDGEYTFRVTAMNAYGALSEEAGFSFKIATPWYKAWWAFILYAIMGGILIRLLFFWRMQKLEKQSRLLQEKVNEKTEEVLTQKEAIETQNKELAVRKERLESMNEEKSHLIGILAHDMRNPLHQIKSSVDILRIKNPDMEQEGKFLNTIERSASHLNGMIGKILDLEAIESQRTNVELERVDLAQTMRGIAESLQETARNKGIELHPRIPDRPLFAQLDRNFSTQVLENLTTNAIKFSPENKHIYLGLSSEDGFLRASVQDQGPGISRDDQKKLFGKFQKLSARPTGGEQSTGLGLSIVKKYVEAMNGKVWCESSLGEGATFYVQFPEWKVREMPKDKARAWP